MNGMKEAYTTQELAPLLGMTRQGVDCRAKREGWQSRPRAGRGGGREWLVTPCRKIPASPLPPR